MESHATDKKAINKIVFERFKDLPPELMLYVFGFLHSQDLDNVWRTNKEMQRLADGPLLRYRVNFPELTQGSLWKLLLTHSIDDAVRRYAVTIFGKNESDIPSAMAFFDRWRNEKCGGIDLERIQPLMQKDCLECFLDRDKLQAWLNYLQDLARQCPKEEKIYHPNEMATTKRENLVIRVSQFLRAAKQLEDLINLWLMWEKIDELCPLSSLDENTIDFNYLLNCPQWSVGLTGKGLLLINIDFPNSLFRQLLLKEKEIASQVDESTYENQQKLQQAIKAEFDKLKEKDLVLYAKGYVERAKMILRSKYLMQSNIIRDESLVKIIIAANLTTCDFQELSSYQAFHARLHFEVLMKWIKDETPFSFSAAQHILCDPELMDVKYLSDKQIVLILKQSKDESILKKVLDNPIFMNRIHSALLVSIAACSSRYALYIADNVSAVLKLTLDDLIKIKKYSSKILETFLTYSPISSQLTNYHLVKLIKRDKENVELIFKHETLVAKFNLEDFSKLKKWNIDPQKELKIYKKGLKKKRKDKKEEYKIFREERLRKFDEEREKEEGKERERLAQQSLWERHQNFTICLIILALIFFPLTITLGIIYVISVLICWGIGQCSQPASSQTPTLARRPVTDFSYGNDEEKALLTENDIHAEPIQSAETTLFPQLFSISEDHPPICSAKHQ